MSEKKEFANPKYFENRELSWLKFNNRVLEEARDKQNPLLERVRFLSISQSNLDEWFMVRVASLAQMVKVGYEGKDAAGMTPKEQLSAASAAAGDQVKLQYQTWSRVLVPALKEYDIQLLHLADLDSRQYDYFEDYFDRELFPVLTPMADDETRPFPFLANDSINVAVRLTKPGTETDKKEKLFATLQVPDNVFPRIILVPGTNNHFVLLEEVIKEFLAKMFLGYEVKETATYRVLRDMELDVAEDDTPNLLKEVQAKLVERERGAAIRLEIESTMGKHIKTRLQDALKVDDFRTYAVSGPIDLTFLSELVKAVKDFPELSYPKFKAYQAADLAQGNIFDTIRNQDQLLHHPYDTFDSVVRFIQQAAEDSDVLAIKMTLYRVSGDSPIIKALGLAARNGKQVTALVEVKARFDEENNVHWAQELERMGVHVIYGLRGLKTHSKLALVVRREGDEIRRYMHMGTGNYNDVTAHFYTDLGLLTSDTNMGIDAANVFNILSGYSEPEYFHKLHISPDGIREFLEEKIAQEVANAKAGKPAYIKFKANSISDAPIVQHLYAASKAGVKVDLIVRGISILKIGIPEVSENIEVHSIVGRFLEHSRIYMFANDGAPEVYLSSADLMSRNLNRRVELLFPVEDPALKQRVEEIFDTQWHDNVKTRVLQADGSYQKVDRRGTTTALDAQMSFVEAAASQVKAQAKAVAKAEQREQFMPLNNPFDDINKPTNALE